MKKTLRPSPQFETVLTVILYTVITACFNIFGDYREFKSLFVYDIQVYIHMYISKRNL